MVICSKGICVILLALQYLHQPLGFVQPMLMTSDVKDKGFGY